MLALQASIGALNDLVDAPLDAGRKPGKPIPAGLVTSTEARRVVVLGAGIGIALAATSGPGLALLAIGILGVGYAYDLRAKGTAWSWLPFAIGIPLLPVFGWFGVDGRVPDAFLILLPTAVVAGAGLAIANARADRDRDLDAGLDSVAIRLGLTRAWVIEAVLLGAAVAVAIGSVWLRGGQPGAVVATLLAGLVVATGLVIGRDADAARRERAWEVEAVGVALLAVAWLVGYGGLE